MKTDIKNLKIGESFIYCNKEYEIVAGECIECDFLICCENCIPFKEEKPNCFYKARKDKTSVIFKLK